MNTTFILANNKEHIKRLANQDGDFFLQIQEVMFDYEKPGELTVVLELHPDEQLTHLEQIRDPQPELASATDETPDMSGE